MMGSIYKGNTLVGFICTILVAGFLLFGTSCSILEWLQEVDSNKINHITDDSERIVIYHGLNVANSAKYHPHGLPWQSKEDFARLNDWGFNLVRYLIFWHAIEPRNGTYDSTYLKKTIERIHWLRDLGIDVLLDMHQDLYAKPFSGNGFPKWTINDNGYAFDLKTPWNLNYLEPAVVASYNNFWKNDSLQSKYVAAIEYVLHAVDTIDNVIGIDVMNEPFPGTNFDFEKVTLSGLYTNIRTMMKRNGFRVSMFFEPAIQTSAGLLTKLQFPLDSQCVYAPHYYDPFCHEGKPYLKKNRILLATALALKMRETMKMNVPLLFGEFGISGNVKNYKKYLQEFTSLCDQYSTGWVYYSYDRAYSDDGFGVIDREKKMRPHLDVLIRVYPQRVAGTNPQYGIEDNRFVLEYVANGGDTPTEIFIPLKLELVKITVNGVIYPHSGTIFKYNNDGPGVQSITISWE